MLLSAFKNREARTPFDDEASLLKQFPYRLSVSEYMDGNYPVQPGISYQSNDAYIRPFPDPGTSTITAFSVPNNIPPIGDPNMGQLHEHNSDVQSLFYEFFYGSKFASSGDNCSLMSQINGGILSGEPPSCQQSNARPCRFVFSVAIAKVWVLRAKKRVMALKGIHAHKKQKT